MNTFQASYQAPQMKASDADRDAVVSALSENYQAGRLTSEELEERTGRALSARTFGELQSLTADLPGPLPSAPQPDPQPGPVPAMPGETARYRRSVRRLPLVIAVIVVIAIARVGLSLGTGHSGAWLLIPIALVALRLGMLRRGGRRGGGFRGGNGGLFGGNEDSRGTRRF
jgi:Domain of unknown function (DUF1707)